MGCLANGIARWILAVFSTLKNSPLPFTDEPWGRVYDTVYSAEDIFLSC